MLVKNLKSCYMLIKILKFLLIYFLNPQFFHRIINNKNNFNPKILLKIDKSKFKIFNPHFLLEEPTRKQKMGPPK